ncbi:MAG: hypothetical protein QGG40_01920, partial [Myxococcota bacterium]|nr:hypothetical protein [Myxococcota bacterium]
MRGLPEQLQLRWLGVYVVLAVAWTWPAAVTTEVLGIHPDAEGTAWFVDAAPRLWDGLHDELTGWPEGVVYGRPDSFVLMGLATLLQALSPARLLAWLALFGVALSAWVADGFARALGARPPWSIVAGLSFGFCGLAATALLEGYVYHLVDPWLPALGWAWWRATGRDGQVRHGVMAGLAFTGALWTTAYLGVAAALLVLGMLLGTVLVRGARRRLRRGPLGWAAATVTPGVLAYLALFLSAQDAPGSHRAPPGSVTAQLSRTLTRWIGPTVETDFSEVSQSPALVGTVLVLFAVSPVVLSHRQRWRPLAWAACLALGLALLPQWTFRDLDEGGALQLLLAASFRFPDRFLWVWQLCAGVVAAQVLTELGQRHRKGASVLVGAALLDAFFWIGMPGRQGSRPSQVPTAYSAHEGPVLDLFPEGSDPT